MQDSTKLLDKMERKIKMPSSSEELLRYCQDVPDFTGVYPSDRLPDIKSGSFIVNYDPHNRPGSHWVAARITPHGEAQYFDSFGLPPDAGDLILRESTNFTKYLLDRSKKLIYNRFPLQNIRDEVCGRYAVFFIRHGMTSHTNHAWDSILAKKTSTARDMEVSRLV